MPDAAAGIGFQCESTGGEKIVAGAHVAHVRRRRVAAAPEQNIELGVVAPSDPGRTSTLLPGIILPGVVPEFARTGDGVELPLLGTRLGIVRDDEATNAELAARDTHDDRDL